jgi:hypothetical protein
MRMKGQKHARPAKLSEVRRRLKHGSSKVRSMTPEARAAGVTKQRKQPSQADREQAARLDQLRAEARYRRERLELYRARMYGGRARNEAHLNELQRANDGAASRLRSAEAAAQPATREA